MTTTITDISVKTIDGQEKSLGDHLGKVLLIVNVASYCGYTSQYRELEALVQKYGARGLVVLGFPCNDFGAQEPGSNDQILQFCTLNYGVTFEIFDKVRAIGSPDPLFARLKAAITPSSDVSWNFEKFLINRLGEVVARYRSSVAPDSAELIAAIETELNKN